MGVYCPLLNFFIKKRFLLNELTCCKQCQYFYDNKNNFSKTKTDFQTSHGTVGKCSVSQVTKIRLWVKKLKKKKMIFNSLLPFTRHYLQCVCFQWRNYSEAKQEIRLLSVNLYRRSVQINCTASKDISNLRCWFIL